MAAVLVGIGWAAYGAYVPWRTAGALAVTVVVGAACFCCLGYGLAALVRNEDAALPITQALLLPLYFISGVFVSAAILPRWLADVANVFPVRHLASALLVAYDPHTAGLGFLRAGSADHGRVGGRGPDSRLAQIQVATARALITCAGAIMEEIMASETETKKGQCAEHGEVDATREIPNMGFPFIYFAIVRAMARRKPFRCPECGAVVASA
jgi:hypothetical protein